MSDYFVAVYLAPIILSVSIMGLIVFFVLGACCGEDVLIEDSKKASVGWGVSISMFLVCLTLIVCTALTFKVNRYGADEYDITQMIEKESIDPVLEEADCLSNEALRHYYFLGRDVWVYSKRDNEYEKYKI